LLGQDHFEFFLGKSTTLFDNCYVDVFIARHAIFDRSLSLFGYELLFRSCERNTAEIACDTASTLQVLANSLLSSGLVAAQKLLHIWREIV
jgi:c-di-GMP-related signal transduction protein